MKPKKNSVLRALRGGSFINDVASGLLRVSLRYGDGPEVRDRDVGFRFVVRGGRQG